jgi:hypothetical protein
MPDLHACYFCGEVGDGLVRRVVVSAERTAGTEPVTAVLCPRCDRKLSRIVEPFVDADPESGATGHSSGGDTADEISPGDDGSDDAAKAEPESGVPKAEPESDAADEATDAGDPEVDGTRAGTGAEEDAAGRQGAGDSGLSAARIEDDIIVAEGSDPGPVENDPGPDAETAADAAPEPPDAGDDGASEISVRPRAFRKVMRLLSNREFPVDRAEFESLASNAYDLEESDVAAMLDAAVERNLIGERDGHVVRN